MSNTQLITVLENRLEKKFHMKISEKDRKRNTELLTW